MTNVIELLKLENICLNPKESIPFASLVIIRTKVFKAVAKRDGTITHLLTLYITDSSINHTIRWDIWGDDALLYKTKIRIGSVYVISRYSIYRNLSLNTCLRGGNIRRMCSIEDITSMKEMCHPNSIHVIETFINWLTIHQIEDCFSEVSNAKNVSSFTEAVGNSFVNLTIFIDTQSIIGLHDCNHLTKNSHPISIMDNEGTPSKILISSTQLQVLHVLAVNTQCVAVSNISSIAVRATWIEVDQIHQGRISLFRSNLGSSFKLITKGQIEGTTTSLIVDHVDELGFGGNECGNDNDDSVKNIEFRALVQHLQSASRAITQPDSCTQVLKNQPNGSGRYRVKARFINVEFHGDISDVTTLTQIRLDSHTDYTGDLSGKLCTRQIAFYKPVSILLSDADDDQITSQSCYDDPTTLLPGSHRIASLNTPMTVGYQSPCYSACDSSIMHGTCVRATAGDEALTKLFAGISARVLLADLQSLSSFNYKSVITLLCEALERSAIGSEQYYLIVRIMPLVDEAGMLQSDVLVLIEDVAAVGQREAS